MASDFSLLTTTRYDKMLSLRAVFFAPGEWTITRVFGRNIYLWDHHHRRLLKGAKYFGWKRAVKCLETTLDMGRFARKIDEFVGPDVRTPLRLRILLNPDGSIEMSKHDIPAAAMSDLFPERLHRDFGPDSLANNPQYTLVVDPERTKSSAYTRFKSTRRDVYDAARSRAQITPSQDKEVLLVNADNGHVMEGSITTPYFWRGNRWVTPPVARELHDFDGSGGQDGVTRLWALNRGLAVEQVVTVESLVDGEICWLSNGARGFMSATLQLTT